MNERERNEWLSRFESKLDEYYEYTKLQEKQPDFGDHTWDGAGEGRGTVRKGWMVVQSDYEDIELGTGVVVYRVDKTHLRVEVWEKYQLLRAFTPLHDLEAYCQICDEKGWIPEAII